MLAAFPLHAQTQKVLGERSLAVGELLGVALQCLGPLFIRGVSTLPMR